MDRKPPEAGGGVEGTERNGASGEASERRRRIRRSRAPGGEVSRALHPSRGHASALDGTGSLVYHRSVAGPEVDADTFEAVDFEGWRAVAVDGPRGVPMAQLRTPLTPGVTT